MSWKRVQSQTRWYSSNGPAARLLRWTVFVLCLVTYGHLHCGHTCHKCYMYSCPNVQISAECHTCHYSRKLTLSGKLLLQRRYFFWEVLFLRKLHFLGNHIFQEVTFPGKTHFPGNLHLPGSNISNKVTFPGN